MDSRSARISDVVVVVSLLGLSLAMLGNPAVAGITGLLGGAASSWAASLSQEGWTHCRQYWLGQRAVRNDDLQQALRRAFERAISYLDRNWWETDAGRDMRAKGAADPTIDVFKKLHKEVASVFADLHFTQFINDTPVRDVLTLDIDDTVQTVTEWFDSHIDPGDLDLVELRAYIGVHLAPALTSFFGEELQTDTRARHAYERLLLEAVQEGLAHLHEVPRKVDEVARLLNAVLAREASVAGVLANVVTAVRYDILQVITHDGVRTRETVVHESVETRIAVEVGTERMVGAVDAAADRLAKVISGTQRFLGQEHLAPDDAMIDAAHRLFATLPLDAVPAVATVPAGSRMPLSRNPLFVGRESDLKTLARALKAGDTAAIGQVEIAAATGLGGIGKTQLAAEFVYHYGRYFAGGVFWLSLADATAVAAQIAECGHPGYLGLYHDNDPLSLDDQVRLVRAAWRGGLPYLLVFDNCEDEDLLAQWRPPTGECRVLVTSRRAHWAAALAVTPLPLGVLPRMQSRALLHWHRRDLSTDDPDLAAIAAELGDLPLALHLAGSYLARYRHALTPAAYLAQLRRPDLLEHPSLKGGELSPTGHELNVARTFALSYDRLSPTDVVDGRARALLARAAILAPGEPIPRDILLATVSTDADDVEGVLQAEDALHRLEEVGLLEVEAAGALRLHRLLTVFVRNVTPAAEAEEAVEAVETVLLEQAERLNAAGYPASLLPLQPHLRVVIGQGHRREDEQAAALCVALGSHLREIGEYGQARPLLERALAIRERVLGPEHPDTAADLSNLAALLQAQGDYGAARPLYERALTIAERVLGPEHPNTAAGLNNLAFLLRAQGDYDAARPLYERALTIAERVLGSEHPDTARSLSNLAALLKAQGDYGARPLYERALAIRERVFGSEHPDTAAGLSNLALLLQAQGDYDAARPLYERALAIRERVLGSEHPNTARSLSNLAGLLQAQGDYGAARLLYERALAIRERVLGSEHPDTAAGLNNLAALLQAQGDYGAARPLYERALTIAERVLGSEHPNTAAGLNNLAGLLQAQGDYDAAHLLVSRVLAIAERVLGANHPSTQIYRANLAIVRSQARKNNAALYPHGPRPDPVQSAPDAPRLSDAEIRALLNKPKPDKQKQRRQGHGKKPRRR